MKRCWLHRAGLRHAVSAEVPAAASASRTPRQSRHPPHNRSPSMQAAARRVWGSMVLAQPGHPGTVGASMASLSHLGTARAPTVGGGERALVHVRLARGGRDSVFRACCQTAAARPVAKADVDEAASESWLFATLAGSACNHCPAKETWATGRGRTPM